MGQKTILITGGAGYIVNLDKLTYAGNLENLKDIENAANYSFEKGDIVDAAFIDSLFKKYDFDGVIHLAAESHVDRSIENPLAFIETNILGTMNLLNAARNNWESMEGKRFYHVSTDEVYGSLGETGFFVETTAYDPRSPYSASKASSDHLVRAYHHTYKLPIVISNCSNNYGPNQFPEKLIPLVINNIKHNKPLPIYGDGKYTRDWLWVIDHAEAIDTIFHDGVNGETYNIGGNNEWKNIDLVESLCDVMDELLGREQGSSRKLITFVKDRAGHDRRYAIDASKLKDELNWGPKVQAIEGLRMTAEWYLSNESWMENVTSGAYKEYYEDMYAERV